MPELDVFGAARRAGQDVRDRRANRDAVALDRIFADSFQDFDQQAQPTPMAPAPAAPAAPQSPMMAQPAEEKGIAAPQAMPSAPPMGPPQAPPAAAAASPAPQDPRRRLVGNLARSGVRGSGRAAFGVSQQVQSQEDAVERAAITALARGDDLTYSHFARKLGKELVPPQLLQDARQKRMYAQGALVAEKLYKDNPQQAHTFLQAYMRSGGNVEASLATAGQPYGRGLGRNQIVGYFDQNGQERAGIPMFGPDGRVVMQEVPGVSRLAPTGRRAGTGAAAGMKPMTYGQARTRALAELRAAGDGYSPITPQQVEQRTRQIMQEQARALAGEEPPDVPETAPTAEPPPADEGPGLLERGLNWMFGGGAEASPQAPQNGAPLPKPAANTAGPNAGRTRQYVPGRGFVDVMP